MTDETCGVAAQCECDHDAVVAGGALYAPSRHRYWTDDDLARLARTSKNSVGLRSPRMRRGRPDPFSPVCLRRNPNWEKRALRTRYI